MRILITGADGQLGRDLLDALAGRVPAGGLRCALLGPEGRAFLIIGVLGGFTTFSTFAFESFQLLRDGQFLWAAVNIAGQVAAGIIGLWAGFVIGLSLRFL